MNTHIMKERKDNSTIISWCGAEVHKYARYTFGFEINALIINPSKYTHLCPDCWAKLLEHINSEKS